MFAKARRLLYSAEYCVPTSPCTSSRAKCPCPYSHPWLSLFPESSDYVDYMMGHTVDTYHDIQSLGIEKLCQTYANADLKISARTKLSDIELIKEYNRARGLNPEQILTRESLAEGATIYTAGEDVQDYQLRILRNTFRDLVRKDIDETVQMPG